MLPPDSGAAAVVACAPGHVRDTKRENTLESDDTVDHADKVTPRLQSLYRLQCYSRLTTPQLKYTHKAHTPRTADTITVPIPFGLLHVDD